MSGNEDVKARTREFVNRITKLADESCRLFDEYRDAMNLSEEETENAIDVIREVMDGSRSDVDEITQDLLDVISYGDVEEGLDK